MQHTLTIDGKEWSFKYSNRLWAEWEKKTGLTQSSYNDNDTIENMCLLIHLGLKLANPEKDIPTVDNLIDDEESFLADQFVEILLEEAKRRTKYLAERKKKKEAS